MNTTLNGLKLLIYPECGEVLLVPNVPPQVGARGTAGRAAGKDDRQRTGQRSVSSLQRSRARVRRYLAANRLDLLTTLTFSPPQTDWLAASEEVGKYLRKLRRRYGPFAWLRVVEAHRANKGGVSTGWHAHIAHRLQVPHSDLDSLWEGGGSNTVAFRGRGKEPAHARLFTYIVKDFAATGEEYDAIGLMVPRGARLYEVARGFQPVRIERDVASVDEANDVVATVCGVIPKWRQLVPNDSYQGRPVRIAKAL